MKRFTLLLALLMTFAAAFSQKSWLPLKAGQQPEEASISIEQSNRASLTLVVNVPGLYLQELQANDMTFQHISLNDGHSTELVGLPELPMLHQVIGIPGNQKVSFNIIEMETTTLSGYQIYPFQTPTTDNPGGHDKAFVMDQAFYSRDVNYPAENLNLDQPQIWRDVKLTGLHITPFTYNPATKELTAITHMRVEVNFEGEDASMNFNPKMELSPKFYSMYEAAIPNFDDLGYTLTYREEPGIKYLVITNEEALDAIQPLVDWKNQMGHTTEVRTLEAGFEDPQDFKTYITELYQEDGLEYVLMVGDAYPNGGSGGGDNIVPMYYWNPGGDASYSDSWYTCLDGPSDHFADLAIGRFVYDANSLDELELQIGKTMTHYLTPDMSDNWAENTILVAHKEQYPGKYTQCCNEITTFDYSIQTPIFEKAYGGENYTNAQVVEFVNSTGVGIFNYRGHGSATQLWDWTNSGPSHFTAAEVSQLNNVDKLFVFFDVCCDNMDIVAHANDCLCESFMKHETGSVAVNGAIIPSYTIPNHDYDKEMYKALFEENITNIGYITNYANLTVLNVHGEIGKSNVRTYLWLGDASIEPWTMQPTELAVSHDQQLFLGMSEFSVTVSGSNGSTEGAMVCVSNADRSIYGVAYADGSGLATIDFGAAVQDPGNVMVTVTGHNYVPYQAEIPVIPQEGAYVVKDSFVVNDAAGNGNGMMDYAESILISLSVKNVGIVMAENVVVTISTEDEYVTITDGEENYGNVDPDEVVTIEDGFALDVAENIPDGHAVIFDVMASDGTDGWASTLVISGHAPALAFNGYSVDDASGNNNGFLDPGETVEMTVNVINNGSADAYTVIAALTSSDPLFSIITSDPQEIGDLVPDANGDVVFTVSADESIVPGYMGELDLLLSADFNIEQEDVVLIPFTDYCEASTSTEDEYIANVAIGDIDNPSDWQGGVANYTDLTTTLQPGVAEGITIENGTAWASDQVTVWIDWNMDKELGSDPNETFVLTNVGGSGQTFTGDITPPANQQGGQYRMRIRMTYSSTPAPCGSSSYGEIEDYTILIDQGMTASFNADLTEVCEGNEIAFTDNSSGDVTSWSWVFEGGEPATSTEQNPVVMYMEGGNWDVELTVTGLEGSNTMMQSDFITTMYMPETAGEITGSEEVCQGWEEIYAVDLIGYADEYTWVLEPAEAGEMMVVDNMVTIAISSDYEGAASLKVCGGNECGDGGWSSEFSIIVNTCVGIDELNNDAVASLFPNPTTGEFTLELIANDVVNVMVMNTIGEIVYSLDNLTIKGQKTMSIDLNALAEGVYYLRIQGNTTSSFEKIVVAR